MAMSEGIKQAKVQVKESVMLSTVIGIKENPNIYWNEVFRNMDLATFCSRLSQLLRTDQTAAHLVKSKLLLYTSFVKIVLFNGFKSWRVLQNDINKVTVNQIDT